MFRPNPLIFAMPIWLHGESAVMTKSIEDILVCIHDDPELDEHTSWGEWFVK